LAFARAAKNGTIEQKLGAEVAAIEAALAARTLPAPQALKRLDHIRYVWRGGPVEKQALQLSYRIASQTGHLRSALSAGSALFHYHQLGAKTGPLVMSLQKQLAAALDPSSQLPLDQALGLYWDFRDLTPLGAEGDLLVSRLGERLQEAGLYARAADLFEHQLFARVADLAQGPLSVKVARLHILAGRPDRALDAIRRTAAISYPADMLWQRRRVEAVALSQRGRPEEALAVLDGVPDGAALRTAILWKKRDWSALAAAIGPTLPATASLSEVHQAEILRYAVALAMLGHEAELEGLAGRYGAAFSELPTGPAFAALTGRGPVDGDALARAMASIPSASAAGDIGDLLEAPVAKGL